MPKARKSVLGRGELHFVSCASYRHLHKLAVDKHRDLLCQLLEELRVKFRFSIVGYVVLPSVFHMLLTEPEKDSVDEIIQTLRQRYQRRYNTSVRSDEPAWEKSYSDLHVVTPDQIVGFLSTMHQAPVKAGLVEAPTEWSWSSALRYAGLPEGVVTVEPSSDPRTQIVVSQA
ncbi:transposase [Acidipila sp. EB88]|uniref:transposase n=1 Tax=Acidipila sp. EB88 TaxID=2305226 RepID=UPI000F5EAB09|nr:transposase [Acidipila sp. EB88]RRA48702.1 hypothetical protein D1Y84_10825 [Acidipila sp. EB88]